MKKTPAGDLTCPEDTECIRQRRIRFRDVTHTNIDGGNCRFWPNRVSPPGPRAYTIAAGSLTFCCATVLRAKHLGNCRNHGVLLFSRQLRINGNAKAFR
jgi:hypothetical protein